MTGPGDIVARLRARAAEVAGDLPDVVAGFDAACDLQDLYLQAANEIEQLQAAAGVHAGIVARINDGWDYVRPAASRAAQRGTWFRLQDGSGAIVMKASHTRVPQEPMTDAQQLVIYGEVVNRSASDSSTTKEGGG